MAYYADLSPYTYHSPEEGMVNIGWLDNNHDFRKGFVNYEFITALRDAMQKPTRIYRGFHVCELCDPPKLAIDNKEYYHVWAYSRRCNEDYHFKNDAGRIYVFPGLICHYISDHQYVPPKEFIESITGKPIKLMEKKAKLLYG